MLTPAKIHAALLKRGAIAASRAGTAPAPGANGNSIPTGYSPLPILPQSQSPLQLGAWLARNHPRYNLSAWCFYGNLIDSQGNVSALLNLFQYQNFPDNDNPVSTYLGWKPYVAAFAYCDQNTSGYALAGTFSPVNQFVEFTDPFSFTVDSFLYNGGLMSVSLTAGQMGAPNAQYMMTATVVDLNNDEWTAVLHLTDTFGAIQVGYGPSSFLPQWVFPNQLTAINANYGGSVPAYLSGTGDEMKGQGSYYYSLPMLQVTEFTLLKNRQAYASGSQGAIWVDYVVQSFDAASLAIAGAASWVYFAFQFPAADAVLMVSIVTTQTGPSQTSVLPMARLYLASMPRAANGALPATFEWALGQITYTPKSSWTDPKGNSFPIECDFTLDAPNCQVALTAKAVRSNQEIVIQDTAKYEGVYQVGGLMTTEGSRQITPLAGYAWGEVHSNA